MGFRDLVLFFVVTGVSLRWIATAASAGPSAIVIWLVAWVGFFLPLAFTVVELGSRHPDTGGIYTWAKIAFGDFGGFMTGWTYWASNLPYFPSVLYFTASNALYIFGTRYLDLSTSPTYYILFSVAAMVLATGVNIVGLGVGKWLHNLGGIGTWAPVGILLVIAGIAWARFGSATAFTASAMVPSTHLKDLIFFAALIFAFGGSEAASFMGDEIRNPRQTLPRALLLAGTLVTLAYIAGTAAVLIALPQREVTGLAGIMEAITRSADRIGVIGIAPIVALLVALSNIGAVGAWLAATARLPFVAGLDHYLPRAFARMHPRWGTPWVALLTQAGLGVIFIFLGQAGTSVKGAYDVMVSMGIIAYEIPYLFTFAAMIKLQSEPAGPEVWRVPGGRPVATALAGLGFLTTSVAIVLSLIPADDETNKPLAVLKVVGLTVLLLGIGVGVYLRGKRRRGVMGEA